MEEEIDGTLGIVFLDIKIHRETERVNITIYRKPTHSGVYTNWLSFCPTYMKHNLVYTLVNRAWQICSSYKLWHIEVNKIKSMLMANGYNESLIDMKIGQLLDKTLATIQETTKPEKEKK